MATATRKSYYQRPNSRYLPTDRTYHITGDSEFEFDESDLYSSTRSDSPDFRRKLFTSSRRSSPVTVTAAKSAASSLPMNVPDWSKILGKENNRHIRRKSIENDDDGGEKLFDGYGGGGKLPPHEYLAKTRMASFSVHEGIGRTLKGRDLSRVRNAILEKTGFLD